ncbi:PGC-1 and ERR-induced regulator in muscle protein 1 [Harpia harpyja]|uniref:PGC-1 and ERR-induced regulator in muscle protein 1 n=1 Tax=Harpia harpyja TaxID=202280 RepID=UPI0022B195EC|nr:PGC-1 and ERR-induced regulator in muscle protein 1 [Harpia harpyja]XP_052649292.1 PGC-1 and ERR-induced regulator in muscle protein 1 [Harpia harpyja]
MDNFEYSIQLNDRDWAEFFLASEECSLAPAALATAEEQCLSDIEQGDGVPARDGWASTNGQIAARVGSRPGPGTGTSAPRGVPGDASLRWPAGGHLSLPELLSGSEDEADLGSVSRFLCESDKPGRPSSAPMPSVQGRQPPCPPAAAIAGSAGSAAEGSPGQDAACEAAAPPSEKTAAGGGQATEPPSHPSGTSAPERRGDAGGQQPRGSLVEAQPAAPLQGSLPAPAAFPEGSARKSPSSASRSEPGPLRDHPPSPALEIAPRAPGCPAREEASGERAGAEPSSPAGSPDVVRRKVPGQLRKSRKQRGASAVEAAQGDREPAGAAAQGAGVPVKAPLSSPLSSRKSKGKEKAAKPAPVKLGSEEAGESKRLVPSPGTDEGDPAVSTSPKQKVKEPGVQPLGKAKTTKYSKPGQAGGLDVRDNVPTVPASGATAPPGAACQEAPGKPLRLKSVAACGGDAAEGAYGEPAAETPGELGPPYFAAGASARADTLDVTWPEMYDYFFCDSQGEEEGMGGSVEGEETPLEREISLPELYEYFFNEPEGNRKKVKGKDRKRKKFSSLDHAQLQNEDPDLAPVKDSLVISVPEVYEHFFPDRPGNRVGWRGIFSIAPASEVKKAVGALKSLLQRPMHLVRGQAPAPQALVRRGSEEKLPLVPLAPLGRGQARPEGLDMALALTGRPEAPLALTHKDMCLVFCAFASWAVKTSDLQAPDAWKTMFLASFGTLSAIRYFRRQVREGQSRT